VRILEEYVSAFASIAFGGLRSVLVVNLFFFLNLVVEKMLLKIVFYITIIITSLKTRELSIYITYILYFNHFVGIFKKMFVAFGSIGHRFAELC